MKSSFTSTCSSSCDFWKKSLNRHCFKAARCRSRSQSASEARGVETSLYSISAIAIELGLPCDELISYNVHLCSDILDAVASMSVCRHGEGERRLHVGV